MTVCGALALVNGIVRETAAKGVLNVGQTTPAGVFSHRLLCHRHGLRRLRTHCRFLPLRRALQRHDDAKWSRADLLLVSDGQFEVPREIAAALDERRAERDLRVHGLLVGNDDSSAMTRLCSPLHRFRDWVLAESA